MSNKTTFFSYSRSDSAFVLKLANDLRNGGTEFWLDQLDIKAGSHWDAAIEAALNSAKNLIVVLSPAAVESNNVMDEVSFAFENGKTVIPILLAHCSIPYRLKRLQRIDFTGDYQTGLTQLSKILDYPAGSNASIESKARDVDESNAIERKLIAKQNQVDFKKSISKKYLILGGGVTLIIIIVLGLWVKMNPGLGETADRKFWTQTIQKNDISSYALYLKEFPNGVYVSLAKEKLDSIATQNTNISNYCSTWNSNLALIKKTYSFNLGTGGKTFTNRATLRQVISNIELNSDENLNKMKEKLLNLIDNSPSYSDPNYDMEFTPEAKMIRNQIEIDIQKHIDKCK